MLALKRLRPLALALILIGLLFYIVSLLQTDFHHPQDTIGAAIAVGIGAGMSAPLVMGRSQAKPNGAVLGIAGVLVCIIVAVVLSIPTWG
ncbi:MAG: hypothetical protein Q3962_06120 [Corynebacterium sp.]|nr:hypothetical protein [Corynebacterium sp.]